MQYIFLENKNIDKRKWDSCIKDSYNSSLYGFSWFLDAVCPEWGAIVTEDYKQVMPLPISYMLNKQVSIPNSFLTNLGIYSENILTEKIVNDFIQAIPKTIKYAELSLNCFNKITDNNYDISYIPVYKFDLIHEYSKIYERIYSEVFKTKFNNSVKAQAEIEQAINTDIFIDFLKDNSGESDFINTQIGYRLTTVIKTLIKYGLAHNVACFIDKKICAVGFFMYFKNDAFFPIYAENEIGKLNNASNLILDTFIKGNTVKNIIFEIIPNKNEALHDLVADLKLKNYNKTLVHINRFSFLYKLLINKNSLSK